MNKFSLTTKVSECTLVIRGILGMLKSTVKTGPKKLTASYIYFAKDCFIEIKPVGVTVI